MKCPNCKRLIHPPNENEEFVICPYCIQSTAPVPQDLELDHPPLPQRYSSIQIIAFGLLAFLFCTILYIYLTT
ncbi:MAG: hypothetical protein CL916_11945 [Deltaproteobacteria bacterium]|nr:hypothetical protein [Deltaproteobacteria bacterium]